ncbi:hypothetical protein KUCAC02_014381 [Chaenocephalus aceratus]|uniref:Uncharacterized protein n=1 Tax=Chaenocephalus aceratus TaxID=36190 RepID=A0ACB9WDN9_CHAAC|nr:hypothetical protein KUCAC02_014381 [Chaenocephalus aceratus]
MILQKEMEVAVKHFIVLGVHSDELLPFNTLQQLKVFGHQSLTIKCVTDGAGVLPYRLNAAVGGKVMFTTTLTPGTTFQSVNWKFGTEDILTWNVNNFPAPEYEGRTTFFVSTGSLELRNLALTDNGEYSVSILLPGEPAQSGITRLKVYAPVSNVTVTSSSTELVEFSSVSLSCSSSGSPLSFLWLNSSSEVTGSDRVQITDGGSTLTIVNVTRYDQGPFRCRVSNPISEGTSAPVTLSIYSPVSKVTVTSSSTELVEFNSSVRLSCSSSGSPLSFLWLNSSSEGTSAPVTLSICYGPENTIWTISPPKEHHQEGSDISLSCSADSGPPAVFKWFLNGDLLSDPGPDLSLMNVQMNQSGSYSCQAFNEKTLRYETSTPASISVLKKVSGASVTSPSNLPIEGNSFRLICDAAGSVFTRDNPLSSEEAKYAMIVNYGPETVQITGPSQIHVGGTFKLTCWAASVPTANYTWMPNTGAIINSAVIYRTNTELSDSGNYFCEARNYITGRKSSAVHELSVTHTAQSWWSSAPSVCSCSSSGSPLSFLWLNSSSEVTGSDRVQITDGGSTLTIVNVTRYDKGPFRCQVFNPASEGTSDPLNLTIYYGPEHINLVKSPSWDHYEKGSNISLMCSADSRPSAVFKWFLNGSQLSDTGSELSLRNVQISQSGNYSCQAFNNKTLRESIRRFCHISSQNRPIEGNSFRLICDAAGSVFTREWRKGGLDLTLTVNMTLTTNSRELSFSSLNKDHTGGYSCIISNPLSSEEATYAMIVNYGPETVQITGPKTKERTFCWKHQHQNGPEDNGAYTRSQEMHYADVHFTKKNNGETVQMGDQNKPSDYAEHNKRPAPQPEITEIYAQVRKN